MGKNIQKDNRAQNIANSNECNRLSCFLTIVYFYKRLQRLRNR